MRLILKGAGPVGPGLHQRALFIRPDTTSGVQVELTGK